MKVIISKGNRLQIQGQELKAMLRKHTGSVTPADYIKWSDDQPNITTLKYDGEFTIFHYDVHGVDLVDDFTAAVAISTGTGGKIRYNFSALDEFKSLCLKEGLKQFTVAGELYGVDDTHTKNLPLNLFIKVLHDPKLQDDRVRIALFKLVGHDIVSYRDELSILNRIFGRGMKCRPVRQYYVHDSADAKKIYKEFVTEKGNEGLMVHPSNSNKVWKIKPSSTVDVVIIGMEKIGPRMKRDPPEIGSLRIALMDHSGNLVDSGNVGNGWSDLERRQLYQELISTKVGENDKTIWVKPKHILEVKYESVLKVGLRPLYDDPAHFTGEREGLANGCAFRAPRRISYTALDGKIGDYPMISEHPKVPRPEDISIDQVPEIGKFGTTGNPPMEQGYEKYYRFFDIDPTTLIQKFEFLTYDDLIDHIENVILEKGGDIEDVNQIRLYMINFMYSRPDLFETKEIEAPVSLENIYYTHVRQDPISYFENISFLALAYGVDPEFYNSVYLGQQGVPSGVHDQIWLYVHTKILQHVGGTTFESNPPDILDESEEDSENRMEACSIIRYDLEPKDVRNLGLDLMGAGNAPYDRKRFSDLYDKISAVSDAELIQVITLWIYNHASTEDVKIIHAKLLEMVGPRTNPSGNMKDMRSLGIGSDKDGNISEIFTNGEKYYRNPKPKSVFDIKVKSEKWAKAISLKSVTLAKASITKLTEAWDQTTDRKQMLRLKRYAILAGNRAKIMGNNENNSPPVRNEKMKIARLYYKWAVAHKLPSKNPCKNPKEYLIYNVTDGVYLSHETHSSEQEAEEYLKKYLEMIKARQGTWLTHDHQRLPVEQVEFEIQEV